MSLPARMACAGFALALAADALALGLEWPTKNFDSACNLLVKAKLHAYADEPQPTAIKIAPPKAYDYLQLPYPGWVGAADLQQVAGADERIHLAVRSTGPIKGDPGKLVLMVRTEDRKHHFYRFRLTRCGTAKPVPTAAAKPMPVAASKPTAPASPAVVTSAESVPQVASSEAPGTGSDRAAPPPAPAPEAPQAAAAPAAPPAPEEPAPSPIAASEAPAATPEPVSQPEPAAVPAPQPEPAPEPQSAAEAAAGTAAKVMAMFGELIDLPPLSEINLAWLSNKVLELGMHIRSVWQYIALAIGGLIGLLVLRVLLSGLKQRLQRQKEPEDEFLDDEFDDEFDEKPEVETDQAPPPKPDEEAGGEPDEEPNPEIESQLDLATAYIQMGKHDMAQPLLDQILKDGTPEERAKAQELQGRIPAD